MEFLPALTSASGGLAIALIVLALKGFVVLAAASLLCLALQRSPASLKHFYWSAAVAALLVLPVLEVTMPSWTVPVLPDLLNEHGQERGLQPASATPSAAIEKATEQARDIVTGAREAAAAGKDLAASAPSVPESAAGDASATGIAATAGLRTAGGDGTAWASLVLMLWAGGAVVLFLYMLAGTIGAWRIVTRARPVTAPDWLDLIDEMSDRLSIRRPIQLLESSSVRVPMVTGIVRPVVLLPTDASEWNDDRRRCVLAHELAHVKRLDALSQTMVRLACALHWFNPLVWRTARAMHLEREKACDDYVLQSVRTRPSDYASHIIEIARRLPASFTPPAGALSMARRSQLEGRILSILEERTRRPLPRMPALAGLVLAMFVVLPLAALHPTPMDVDAGLASDVTRANETIAVQAIAASPSDVIRRSFRVSNGGTLEIRTDQGNIEVQTGRSGTVDVEVHRSSYGRAAEEEFELSFDQSGGIVRIKGDRKRDYNRGGSGVRVKFVVSVPRSFNVDLETKGGNIALGDLDGRVEVRTAGGNLSFGHVTGKVNARTSGGNISLGGSDSDVRIRTSGGNIRLGRVGGTVDATTSGGNIHVDEVNGKIQAVTSGGQISARIARQPAGDCRLKTSGGSITVYLAPDIRADVDAETSAGQVVSDIDILARGQVRKNRLSGTINGGGPALILDTAAGDIRIRRL